MPPGASVGIVANPASGRDVRRLVTGASVFGNADKAGMVLRALHGLKAGGVTRALMMPAADGLGATLNRHLASQSGGTAELEVLAMPLDGTAGDTTRAVRQMVAAGVSALLVLGGDGTHRVVAKACGDVPICALSTGTNNAFPEMREATVAGLATGLIASGRVAGDDALVREGALRVERDGAEPDLALVDVTVTSSPFVGARALWTAEGLTEIVVAFAEPGAVGLSSIAGLLDPVARGAGEGVHVRLAADGEPALWLAVPLAPGLVTTVGVAEHRRLARGDVVELMPGRGAIALDGEREIERAHGERIAVRLVPGPLRIDVDAVMALAVACGATRTQPARA
jgi:predicted polyphosphate/ATP-dependent NAD kinase